jgi:hypothetical protein
MKLFVLPLVLVFVAGCSAPEQPENVTISNWIKACYDGVLYYSGAHSLAPAFNRDGTLKLCGE